MSAVDAYGADVVVGQDKSRRKAVAAVAYYEQELGAAQESAERLKDKAERLREQAGEAEAAYADAVGNIQVCRDRYEAAKAAVGNEVA